MKYKVYNVGSQWDSQWILDSINVFDPEEADIITFPGGSDVHPKLYGEQVGSYTYPNQIADDRQLKFAYKYPDKIKIGLCRGAQLLTVVSGGKLIQHFIGHNYIHQIMINNNPEQRMMVNSLHHQMMYPFSLDSNQYAIIGRACTSNGASISYQFLNGLNLPVDMPNDQFGYIEPEIVIYKNTNSICFQFHPEMMNWTNNKQTLTFCNQLLNNYYDKIHK